MDVKTEWLLCPVCGRKIHNNVREDTELYFVSGKDAVDQLVDKFLLWAFSFV